MLTPIFSRTMTHQDLHSNQGKGNRMFNFQTFLSENAFTSGMEDCFKRICMCLWERSRERKRNCNWEVIFMLGFPLLFSFRFSLKHLCPKGRRSSRELQQAHLITCTSPVCWEYIRSQTLPYPAFIHYVLKKIQWEKVADEVLGGQDRDDMTISPCKGDALPLLSLSQPTNSKFGFNSPHLALKLLFEGKNSQQNTWKRRDAAKGFNVCFKALNNCEIHW